MALISVSSHVEPSYHLLFLCCEKSGKQLLVFFLKPGYLRLQGSRRAVGGRCKWISLQLSFILPTLGVVELLLYAFGINFDSFVLTFPKLIEGNHLTYRFYLRFSVASLSWGFLCFTGRKKWQVWKANEWNILTGSCWRDYEKAFFNLND